MHTRTKRSTKSERHYLLNYSYKSHTICVVRAAGETLPASTRDVTVCGMCARVADMCVCVYVYESVQN